MNLSTVTITFFSLTDTQRYVVTFTTSQSYIEVPGWRKGDIAFSFRTTGTSAILLFQPPIRPNYPSFMVALTSGMLSFLYGCFDNWYVFCSFKIVWHFFSCNHYLRNTPIALTKIPIQVLLFIDKLNCSHRMTVNSGFSRFKLKPLRHLKYYCRPYKLLLSLLLFSLSNK